MHAKSDSDVTSLAASSPPRSPPKQQQQHQQQQQHRPMYYVQSPSRYSSHDDGDNKSAASSVQAATPVYNSLSPMDSPSHPSSFGGGRHSRTSSGSRFSGTFRNKPAAGSRKGHRGGGGGGGGGGTVNEKGWPECNVIQEEGTYDGVEDAGLSRRCQALLAFIAFLLLFTTFCLIIWGASRPYKPSIIVKSLSVDNFYSGEGTDNTGVPTKLITVNCSLKITVYNPASTFGIHVTSSHISLMYSKIVIGTGQLREYYQPRKSRRTVTVVVQGMKVPIYGAGAGLPLSNAGGAVAAVPLTLDLEIMSRGNVVGKLVRVKHRRDASCPLVVDSRHTKPIKFSEGSCTYH